MEGITTVYAVYIHICMYIYTYMCINHYLWLQFAHHACRMLKHLLTVQFQILSLVHVVVVLSPIALSLSIQKFSINPWLYHKVIISKCKPFSTAVPRSLVMIQFFANSKIVLPQLRTPPSLCIQLNSSFSIHIHITYACFVCTTYVCMYGRMYVSTYVCTCMQHVRMYDSMLLPNGE